MPSRSLYPGERSRGRRRTSTRCCGYPASAESSCNITGGRRRIRSSPGSSNRCTTRSASGCGWLPAELSPLWGDPAAVEQIFSELDLQRAQLSRSATPGCNRDRLSRLDWQAELERSARTPGQPRVEHVFRAGQWPRNSRIVCQEGFPDFPAAASDVRPGRRNGAGDHAPRVMQRLGGEIWFESVVASARRFTLLCP